MGIQGLNNVMLEDLKAGTQQNLSLNSNYSFNAQTNDNPNRFLLHFNSTGINEEVGKTPNIYYGNHSLTIDNPRKGKTILNVYEISGKLIQSLEASEGNSSYPFKPASGVYLFKLVNEYNVFMKKEVVY